MVYRDRYQAGRVLAARLSEAYAGRDDVIVLGLPRGGVPVAHQVAQGLEAPLDMFVVRKLGVPDHEELAMGAIGTGGVLVINDDVVRFLGIPAAAIEQVAEQEMAELERRERLFRGVRPPLDVRDRVVILVDDGIATGSTMRAAVAALRQRGAAAVVVAAPVGSASACAELAAEVDDVVCPLQPEPFFGVGAWYEDFTQTSDDEVRALLQPPEAAALSGDGA